MLFFIALLLLLVLLVIMTSASLPSINLDFTSCVLYRCPYRQRFDMFYDPRSNGTVVDFQTNSILYGLGIKEVESDERMLRRVVCNPGSLSVYFLNPWSAKWERKIIHEAEDVFNSSWTWPMRVSEEYWKTFHDIVIVNGYIHWHLSFHRYIDSLADVLMLHQ